MNNLIKISIIFLSSLTGDKWYILTVVPCLSGWLKPKFHKGLIVCEGVLNSNIHVIKHYINNIILDISLKHYKKFLKKVKIWFLSRDFPYFYLFFCHIAEWLEISPIRWMTRVRVPPHAYIMQHLCQIELSSRDSLFLSLSFEI
jgi:hypothetical protein